MIKFLIGFFILKNQYYPPGTQKNYSGFFIKNFVMEKVRNQNSPKGGEGVRGQKPLRGFNLMSLRDIEGTGGSP